MNEKERQICEDLWKECEPICRSICKSKFQSHPSEINDVISELFLALCQKMDSGEYPNEPKKWIYGTLNNLIKKKFVNLYKDQEHCISTHDDTLTMPLVGPNHIEKLFQKLSNRELKKELENFLSNDEYRLIELIYFEKLKLKQIAKIYHTTESAIKQKHYRICRKLKKNQKNFKNFL